MKMQGKATYKVLDLFGNEELRIVEKEKPKTTLFADYDGFVEKFKPKKTTDDCYTPSEVYNAVLDYVADNYDLQGKEIIRPFFPGGDFENIAYPDNCVVIDNPPFSIVSKICKFYTKRNIPFFLFAPHLTLFSAKMKVTRVVVSGDITYENGAKVKTSFLSNLFGDVEVLGAPELHMKLKQIQENKKVNMPKYVYPKNVLTVSMVAWIVERGIPLKIKREDLHHVSVLESQKKHNKTIFGSGFLLSEKAAAEKAAAEKDNVIVWELSEKEKKIIQSLG